MPMHPFDQALVLENQGTDTVQSAQLWSESGTLLLTSSQIVLYKE